MIRQDRVVVYPLIAGGYLGSRHWHNARSVNGRPVALRGAELGPNFIAAGSFQPVAAYCKRAPTSVGSAYFEFLAEVLRHRSRISITLVRADVENGAA